MLDDRHDEGVNPVVITIFAAILNDAHKGLTALDLVPHYLEDLLGHVRVTHDIVRMADQFFARVAAHLHKGVVNLGNDSFGVGQGNDLS